MQMTALENMSVHQRNVQIHADSFVYIYKYIYSTGCFALFLAPISASGLQGSQHLARRLKYARGSRQTRSVSNVERERERERKDMVQAPLSARKLLDALGARVHSRFAALDGQEMLFEAFRVQ